MPRRRADLRKLNQCSHRSRPPFLFYQAPSPSPPTLISLSSHTDVKIPTESLNLRDVLDKDDKDVLYCSASRLCSFGIPRGKTAHAEPQCQQHKGDTAWHMYDDRRDDAE